MVTLPRPRILFVDVSDDHFERMSPYAPTWKRIQTDEEVHDSDWDLVVSFADHPRWRAVPHSMLVGSAETGDLKLDGTTYAAELAIPDGVPPSVRRLVEQTIVPVCAEPPRSYWNVRAHRDSVFAKRPLGRDGVKCGHVLLTAGSEESVLAFWRISAPEYRPRQHTLVLPADVLMPEAWLRKLLGVLQVDDPERFPPGTAWRDTTEWAPPTLRDAHQAVAALDQERLTVIADLDRRALEAYEHLEAEKQIAEMTWWRLLTETGDELVEVVREALEVVGFAVEVRDEVVKGTKLEDLRVTDPDLGTWTCLVEVKGYTRGAKSNDVMQVAGRPSSVFATQEHRMPDKFWHVVNVQREAPPDQRNVTFSDPGDALAPFVDVEGLVIDTRDLLRAVYQILESPSDIPGVKKSLRESIGMWRPSQPPVH